MSGLTGAVATQIGASLAKNALNIASTGVAIDAQIINSQNLTPVNWVKGQFPEDLKVDNGSAYIDITFQSYKKNTQTQSQTVTSSGGLRLPLPTQLLDNKSVSYEHPSLGPFLGTTMGAFNKQNWSSLTNESLSGVLSNLAGAAGSGTVASAASLAGEGALTNAASALTGTAFNPYQTVLFKTPNFRKHSFSWRFIPRNANESTMIKNIVNLFNSNLLPGISTNLGALLFEFPSVLNIQLYPKQDFLYKFKPCVLESVSANFAPAQTPAFYRTTGAPAAVDLKIDLLEIELWTRNDYTVEIASIQAQNNLALGGVL